MAKILSQEEVDALLSSVKVGDSVDAAEADKVEVSRPKQQHKKVTIYNFRRPDRVSKEQMRSLHFLHDRFARNFSSSLSAFLRALTEINLISVEQLTYSEFLLSVPDPTCFNSIQMKPLEGQIALEINPSLVFPIIDKMLGGPGDSLKETRAMTEIEQNIFQAIIKLILEDLKEIWRQISEIDFKLVAQETSPQLVQIVAPNEVVVLVVFEIKFGDVMGMMNLCIPAIVFEPIAAKFDQEWYTGFKKSTDFREAKWLKTWLKRALFPCAAELKDHVTTITVDEFLSLQEGDIITFNAKPGEDIDLSIASYSKFKGKVVLANNKRVFKIT